jgi:dienelactone hydrolase
MAPPARRDVYFSSGDARCHAWLYLPEAPSADDGPPPVIVMAHGLGAIKALRLGAFAERFQEAGYACLVFDYRHFGDSDGEPRELLSIPRQREDWRAAVTCARSLPEVDGSRVVLWGTSFGGGHAIATAAADHSIAAAIAQCPFTDGIASARQISPRGSARLGVAGAGGHPDRRERRSDPTVTSETYLHRARDRRRLSSVVDGPVDGRAPSNADAVTVPEGGRGAAAVPPRGVVAVAAGVAGHSASHPAGHVGCADVDACVGDRRAAAVGRPAVGSWGVGETRGRNDEDGARRQDQEGLVHVRQLPMRSATTPPKGARARGFEATPALPSA